MLGELSREAQRARIMLKNAEKPQETVRENVSADDPRFEEAIRLLQKAERARQARRKVAYMMEMAGLERAGEAAEEMTEDEASIRIQAHVRRYLARQAFR